MFEITWRRSARDSFLNAVSRLRNLATCASLSSLLLSVSSPGRFDGDGGAVGRQCGDEWRARKMAPTRVILMSCGSYNPPTNMHLRMFEIARDHLHRMGTHVVVGGVISPVHDAYAKKELASATHRCAMLRLSLQNSDWIRLSTWETRQNCWTKTRICLQHHQNLLNSMLSNSNDIKHHLQIEDTDWIPENVKNSSTDNSPIQIKLLCGADLLESFGIPGLWLEEDIDAIVGEHGLVVITREGSNPNKFIYDSDILSKHMNNICIVTEWIPNEVSSTRIRRALKRGESVRYLLQDSVIDYIYKHEIYDARMPDTTIKLELSSPNANNYLHIDPRYLTALLTPSPSDVTMGSPSPVEIVASIDVPDAVVLRKNLQNAAGNGGGLDEIREQFVSVISNNADNGNIKHVSRVAYPGQAKQIIASATGVARILDEVGAFDEPMAKSQAGLSSEEGRSSVVDSAGGKVSGQREVSDFKSKTEIIDVDLGLNDDHEIIVKISSNSGELVSNDDRRLTVDDITSDKEVSNLGSKAEIIDVDLGSSEIIMKVSSDQPSFDEFVPKEYSRSIIKSVAKGQIEIEQKENLKSKIEVTDVDLDSNDDCKLIMKVQSSESSSGELRLGECCWPKRESAANDGVETCDRKIMFEKRIMDAELGLDDKNALKETRSTVEAISDKVNSDRSRFRRVGSEKSSKSIVKSVIDRKVDVSNKEMVNVEVEFTDVVKVQPVHSSHGILTLKDDRRLMIEKLTNELKIKLDEEKNKSKESSQVDKVGKNDTELTELNAEGDMKNNIEVDDVGIDSRKEIVDFESNRTKYLDAKAITSSLNVSMTSLDGRHECALSDFSVDKEDYRLSQYGFDEDEEENKKTTYTARLNLTKYADGQIEDVTDNVDFVNDRESDNRTKSSDEADQLKYIVEESLSVVEVNDKDNNFEGEEQIKEIFRMLQETDKMSRIEKGSELDTHSLEKPMTSCDSSLEIDGKYLKSIVNSRKSPRKIKDGQIHDVEIKEQCRLIDDPQAFQSEAFQNSSTKMKNSENTEEQIYDVDIEEKGQIVKDRETFRAEKVFQDSSRSSSMKTKSPRTVDELQTDESEREMKNHDKSISDREMSRSRKASQKSSKISISTKSPKKKSQIFYRSEDMKDYDRSINDRVITQLEEVFLDSKSSKNDSESELKKQNRYTDNRETSRIEDPSHFSKTSSVRSPKKTQTQKTVKMNENKGQAQETIKTAKDADNKTKCDFNEIKDVYTRKVRRYNVPLQGSLDSMIVSDETSTQKPKKDDAFSKKSKSYESIKRIQEVFLGVPPTKTNSSGSQLDIPDEFCSICCYMNEITFRTEEEVSSPNQETFYTLRSTCSSLADDDDSIECDICGSLNLQESADDLEGKIQEIPCELCKICGEVDGSFDQDSTLPADRYTFKMIESHQDDDDSFEIENCGFQSGTESADDRSRISDKERIKDPGRPKSQSLFIHGSSMNRDQPRELYFIPKDEIAILTSGTRKVNRKGSLFRKKEDSSGNAQDKRRYSSVDSLQLAKISSKGSDKVLTIAKNTTLIGSADNLQISRDSRRSKSLQRSADNVCKDRLNKSIDNLNLQTENLGKENEAEDSAQKLNTRDKEEVKMILTQHGIKIISEKETAL
ncbi:PREDICTED: uncharacterized protein LOC108756464 [Trachymyrmex septentrionalis]|uniref:uncharacterized protein LOC108756464 n=1 Tax=Trachymyrmex septentrionalis TaxID=34720 RepID=UPI00084EDBB7|nr:PREDICTED: uncharacterized protein LOC108756464 [Trachymyrmex septentrionalis]